MLLRFIDEMMRSLAKRRNRRLIAIAMRTDVEAYAAPINIPTASTMAPPSTIWNTAWRNGVSM